MGILIFNRILFLIFSSLSAPLVVALICSALLLWPLILPNQSNNSLYLLFGSESSILLALVPLSHFIPPSLDTLDLI
jgi:integral membrane sensor domain MASE1